MKHETLMLAPAMLHAALSTNLTDSYNRSARDYMIQTRLSCKLFGRHGDLRSAITSGENLFFVDHGNDGA
jgi:hypothetical protein